jgi:predicted dehydrogenase
MDRKISIGMVGLGQFGSEFIQLFRDHPLVDRIALCDIQAERVSKYSKQFEIQETYTSLDDLCKSDIEAVVLITQPWLHAPQAKQVMESGKHVYSAVPIITSDSGDNEVILEWCDRLVQTVERTGQIYMMGETTYYRADTMYCRNRMEEKAFGEIIHIEAEYLHDTYLPACNLIHVLMGRYQKSEQEIMAMGGGVPMHYPTHSTSAPISLLKEPFTTISARGYIHPDDEYYRADSVSGCQFSNEVALGQLKNGATASILEFRRVGYLGNEGFVRVLGTEGSFVNGLDKPLWVTKEKKTQVDVESLREPLPDILQKQLGGHGGSHAYLVHEFIQACSKERTPAISIWDAVRYMAAGVIAHKSAQKDGVWMAVPDWGDPPES